MPARHGPASQIPASKLVLRHTPVRCFTLVTFVDQVVTWGRWGGGVGVIIGERRPNMFASTCVHSGIGISRIWQYLFLTVPNRQAFTRTHTQRAATSGIVKTPGGFTGHIHSGFHSQWLPCFHSEWLPCFHQEMCGGDRKAPTRATKTRPLEAAKHLTKSGIRRTPSDIGKGKVECKSPRIIDDETGSVPL